MKGDGVRGLRPRCRPGRRRLPRSVRAAPIRAADGHRDLAQHTPLQDQEGQYSTQGHVSGNLARACSAGYERKSILGGYPGISYWGTRVCTVGVPGYIFLGHPGIYSCGTRVYLLGVPGCVLLGYPGISHWRTRVCTLGVPGYVPLGFPGMYLGVTRDTRLFLILVCFKDLAQHARRAAF